MSLKKRLTADLLFGVQIIGCVTLCGSQFLRMLDTVQGVSLSNFLSTEIFFLISLVLSLHAHRAQASRITRQALFIFSLWSVLMASNIIAAAAHGSYVWSTNDTVTIVLVTVGSVTAIMTGQIRGYGVMDPVVRGYLAICFKAVPQLFLAAKIMAEGNDGVPGVAIITGHVTILTRLVQVILARQEAKYDRNRLGLLISESANEFSWVIVTIAWLIRS